MIHVNQMVLEGTYFECGVNKVDLHIFLDASLEAMCIVGYLRKQEDGQVAFVIGKRRVAPIRNMTVAKLEMQAAVFVVRLRNLILEEHDIEVARVVYSTNSLWQTALLKFSKIQLSINVEGRHLEGKLNPADIGTRGLTAEALKESEWLTGPALLTEAEDAWPETPEMLQIS